MTYLTVASEQPGDVGKRAKTALTELEQLDPEGVKQARSLMAFGALGRARASTPAATADTTKPSTEAADSSTVPADATIGLAATPAEIQEAESAKPADFADPEGFAQDEPADDEPDAEANAVDAVESNADVSTKSEPVSTPAAPATEVPQQSATPVSSTSTAELNSFLVVGVPLAAAALLMGIYWMILRIGAV